MAIGAARAETEELGLLADPQVASTIAETTANAVQKASAQDGPAKPLTEKERKKFSPESLGLIAFGLSLLGGSDMDQALSAGMNTYESFQGREDRKERQKAIDAFIAKQSPEDQELMRLMGDDVGEMASYIGGRQAQNQAEARRAEFAGDVADRDLTAQMQQRVANSKDPAGELVKVDEESKLVKRNLETMQATHDRILTDIDAIRQMVGGEFYNDKTGQIETVQGMSSDGGLNFFNNFDGLVPLMANIPLTRTKAKDYKQRLDTLKANIGFGELQKMRDNSPTGGALGQVTERELGFLQSVLGAIGTDTNYETLLQTLDKAEQTYRDMLSAAQTDYSSYYGAPQIDNASASQTFSFGNSDYEVQ